MVTIKDVWPVLSIAVNLLLVLLLYSFRTSIRVAILELETSLFGKFATKEDLKDVEARLEDKIDLKKGLTEVRTDVRHALRVFSGGRGGDTTPENQS